MKASSTFGVIPAELRKKDKIKPGTRVCFVEEDDGIKLVQVTPEMINSHKEFLGTGGKLLKILMEEKTGKL